MALTLDAWKTLKKRNGKGAPKLNLTPAFKTWDKALAAVQKTKSNDDLKAANAAFADLKKKLAAAVKTLEGTKFKGKFTALEGDIRSLINGNSIKKVEAELKTLANVVETSLMMAKSANQEEANYTAAWLAFERLSKAGKSRKNHETLLEMLVSLEALAKKVIASGDEKLKAKYKKQLSVIAGWTGKIKDRKSAYDSGITLCIMARRDLTKDIKRTIKLATQAKAQLIKLTDAAAGAEGPQKAAIETKKQKLVGIVLKEAKKVNDPLQPGTVIRASTDVVALKMSEEDKKKMIIPESNAVFAENKKLAVVMDDIKRIAETV